MKLVPILLATVSTAIMPQLTLASENLNDKVHTFSFETGFGNSDYDKGVSSDDGVAHASFRYSYEILPTYEVELGYTVGSDVDDFLFLGLFEDVELDYEAFTLSAQKSWSISKRNSLYAKLGTSSFDYEYTENDKVLVDDSGMGFVAGVGWQLRFPSGFGLSAGFEYHQMKDLKVKAYTLGMNYKF